MEVEQWEREGLVQYEEDETLIMEEVETEGEPEQDAVVAPPDTEVSKEGSPEMPAEVRPLIQRYKEVFPRELPSGLPPLRGIEHHIDLVPGSVLPNRPAYRSDPTATKELQSQIEELMSKGFVRESLSPCAVPALLVPKKDGTWRMCLDSRAINNITIKYRFPIPRLDDMLDELSGAMIFSKIDLRQGYHQVRIREGDEWKTAFKTKHGLYEWLVMPFGLSNAPSTFMRLMTEVLRPCLGKFAVVYFDDILVYSSRGLRVDRDKVAAIQSWPTPKNGQHKLSHRHAKWVEYLQSFTFSNKYKEGKQNVVADALSRRHSLLSTMGTRVLGFEFMKEMYKKDPDFSEEWITQFEGHRIPGNKYLLQDGFLFQGNKLCVPRGSYRDLLIREIHSGGLGGHFGVQKTLDILQEQFHWPKMMGDLTPSFIAEK
ncbi:uncharacterized protein LOC141638109 [Silene latifolia]|uniref:uncharacterized protein LOC141638109 n=1 Tax=Silene latifolia TaxID=37657 RepID=UPI003D782630